MLAKKTHMKLPGAKDGDVEDTPPKKEPDQPVSDTTLQDYLKGQKDDRMVDLLKVLATLKASQQKDATPVGSMAPVLKEQSDRAQAMAQSSPNATYRPGLEPGGLFDAMAKFAGGMEYGEGGTPTLERGTRLNTKADLDTLGTGVEGALDATRREAEQYRSLQPGNGSQYDDDIKFLVDSVMGRGSTAGKADPLANYREPAAGNIESNTLAPAGQRIKPPLSQAAEAVTKREEKPDTGGKRLTGKTTVRDRVEQGLSDLFGPPVGGVEDILGWLSQAGSDIKKQTQKTPKGKQDGGVIPGAQNGMIRSGGFNLGDMFGLGGNDNPRGIINNGAADPNFGLDMNRPTRNPGEGGVDVSGGALSELANKYGVDESRIVRKKPQSKGGFIGRSAGGGSGMGGTSAAIGGVRVFKKGGTTDGHELIQVGERRYDDPNYETSEVVLAAPGTVVAPIPKGMKNPSHEDAMGLIVAQLLKHINGQDAEGQGDPQKAAAGTITGPVDPYKLLDFANSYGGLRSQYDLGRRGINRDLTLGSMRDLTDRRGQDIDEALGRLRNKTDLSKIDSDEYRTKLELASNEREGAAERGVKSQLGNRGLDITASKNNNDFTLGKADQAFQRLMAGMRGGALSGVRAGRAPGMGIAG